MYGVAVVLAMTLTLITAGVYAGLCGDGECTGLRRPTHTSAQLQTGLMRRRRGVQRLGPGVVNPTLV